MSEKLRQLRAFFKAVRLGDEAAVQAGLASGLVYTYGQDHGVTALHQAVDDQEVESVKLLLEGGASVEATDQYGRTPLHYAMTGHSRSMVDIMKILVNNGASATTADYYGERPIHQVMSAEIMKAMLEKGASTEAPDAEGWTALHKAVSNRSPEVVNVLLAAGANPRAKIVAGLRTGQTARDFALEIHEDRLVTLLQGAEEEWGECFLLQVSAQGTELAFRTMDGSVVATFPWPSDRAVQELPSAVRAAIRSSGSEPPSRCEWKFVLPNGQLLDTSFAANSKIDLWGLVSARSK